MPPISPFTFELLKALGLPALFAFLLPTLAYFTFYPKAKRLLLSRKEHTLYILLCAIAPALLFYSWSIFGCRVSIYLQEHHHIAVPLPLNQPSALHHLLLVATAVFALLRLAFTFNYLIQRDIILKGTVKKLVVHLAIRFLFSPILFALAFLALFLIFPAARAHFAALGRPILPFGLCLLTLGAANLFYLTAKNLSMRFKRAHNFVGYLVLKASEIPILFFLMGVALNFCIKAFFGVVQPPPLLQNIAFRLAHWDIALLAFFWGLFRTLSLVEEQIGLGNISKGNIDQTTVQGVTNFLRAALYGALAITLVHKFFGLGALSIGGISIGFSLAAKDILANYLSGFLIYFEGQFKVGEWVYFAEKKEMEGFVEYIGLRCTALRTFDKRLLYIPNSHFTFNSFVNASRMSHRRILKTIPLSWVNSAEVIDKIVQEIRLFIYNHPGIDKKQPLMAHLTDFGEKNVVITLSAFTRSKSFPAFLNVQESVLREAKKIIERYAGVHHVEVLQLPQST